MVVGAAAIYHLSQDRVYQNWLKGNLNTPVDVLNVTTGTIVHDFDASEDQSLVTFVKDSSISGRASYALGANYQLGV